MIPIREIIQTLLYVAKIWSVNAYYNLVCRKDLDIQNLAAERDRLRDIGDPASQLAADGVQQRILTRSGVYVPAPAYNPESAACTPVVPVPDYSNP